MFLSKFKDAFSKGMNKFSGNTDFLEAVCAAAALVANADNDISDDEVAAALTAISSNPKLTSAFSSREIEKCAEDMFARVKSGRTGRMGLMKEIEDISSDHDMSETVYLCALDVAEAEDGIDKDEQAVLTKICTKLGLNPADYDV